MNEGGGGKRLSKSTTPAALMTAVRTTLSPRSMKMQPQAPHSPCCADPPSRDLGHPGGGGQKRCSRMRKGRCRCQGYLQGQGNERESRAEGVMGSISPGGEPSPSSHLARSCGVLCRLVACVASFPSRAVCPLRMRESALSAQEGSVATEYFTSQTHLPPNHADLGFKRKGALRFRQASRV